MICIFIFGKIECKIRFCG